MSQSAEERATGRLLAQAGSGTRIEVIDGYFGHVHLSDTSVDIELPRGLYTVRFSLAGISEEQLVRVRPGEATSVHVKDPVLSDDSATTAKASGERAPRWFQRLSGLMASDTGTGEGAIVVLVQSLEGRISSDVARSVSLVRGDSAETGEIGPSASDGSLKQGWAARRYDCGSGVFALHCETYERKRVMQTVYAMPGSTTMVLLEYGRGRIASKVEGELALTSRRGIDPARSLVFTLPVQAAAANAASAERLARLLAYMLSCKPSRSDTERIVNLREALCGDPLLGLMAASCLLQVAELRHEREPALRAKEFLEAIELPGPDMKCIRWKLADFFVIGRGISEEPLRYPPMLDACWRWAAELSASSPDIITSFGPTIRAAGANPSFLPWLIVGSALRTEPALQGTGSDDPVHSVEMYVGRIIEAMENLQLGGRSPQGTERFFGGARAEPFLKDLGVTEKSIWLAGSVLRVAAREDNKSIVARMARATGMPVKRLDMELRKAADELGSEATWRGFSQKWTVSDEEYGEG